MRFSALISIPSEDCLQIQSTFWGLLSQSGLGLQHTNFQEMPLKHREYFFLSLTTFAVLKFLFLWSWSSTGYLLERCSLVKSSGCSHCGPEFDSQHPQPPVVPTLGDLMPSGLWGHLHMYLAPKPMIFKTYKKIRSFLKKGNLSSKKLKTIWVSVASFLFKLRSESVIYYDFFQIGVRYHFKC